MKLYELVGKYNQLLEIAESGEVDAEALADTLEALEDSIYEKAENTAKVIKSLEGDMPAIDTEIKRLQDMKRTRKNSIDKLKTYLQEQLEAVGMEKVQGDLFTVTLQKNPVKLVVRDESLIPYQYFITPEPVLDKATIKDLLKKGEAVGGVELVQEKSLRIR